MQPTHPLLYEVHTRRWLREWSDRLGRTITLANVPDEAIAQLQALGFTHLWLMGVWTTGPRARRLAAEDPALIAAYDAVLPGWRWRDICGSPYSVADYVVPPALGGDAGLARFRERLNSAGLKLVLDFVPNHLGLDHPWTVQRAELFVQTPPQTPGAFEVETPAGPRWLAHGRDPYFPPWTDTAQLDFRRPATHRAARELMLAVADRCDGLRCDMAMLVLREVFARTWADRPGDEPAAADEFWATAIAELRRRHPECLLLAEVYWGLEGRLQALGFDHTYDKPLYDALIRGDGAWVQSHLLRAPPGFVAAGAHFLENHDEPRAAALLDPARHRAAALVTLGLPGLRLVHEGQLTGARLRLPVQLARRPAEPPDPELTEFYERLLRALREAGVGAGRADLLTPRPAWPGNPSHQQFVLVQWQQVPEAFALVVANLAPHRAQCYAPISVPGLAGRNWRLRDLLDSEQHDRAGDDLAARGLYLDLPAHGAQLFLAQPV